MNRAMKLVDIKFLNDLLTILRLLMKEIRRLETKIQKLERNSISSRDEIGQA